MNWWLWLVIALVLAALEAITPGGFVVLFFAIGALLVGMLAGVGLAEPLWLQGLLFSGFSVGSLLLFRDRLLARIKSPATPAMDSLVGEIATLLEDLPGDGVAKGELRGASWTVRSADGSALRKGQRSRVARVEGLTLWVSGE